jgi:single-strand DNA-binding protein
MANETTVTITGNLTADPELRYTPTGRPVASFTIASTPRYLDRATGQWRDGETWFPRCSAWGDLGENVAASLSRGTAVVATGRLQARTWEEDQPDGTKRKRSVVEVTVDDIGPSMRRASVKVTKVTREHANTAAAVPASTAAGVNGTADPWAANGAGHTDEPNMPPF